MTRDFFQHQTFPKTLTVSLFFSVYRTQFAEFTKSFNVVTSNLYLAYFIPQRDSCILCCARRMELIIAGISFHQIVLCLTIPIINNSGSDSWRLNQHQILIRVELNYLLDYKSIILLQAVEVSETPHLVTSVFTH